MTPRSKLSPPSASLPPVNSLSSKTQEQILALIAGLVEIYCPLSAPVGSAFTHPDPLHRKVVQSDALPVPLVDSGYVSEANEDEDEPDCHLKDLSVIRHDAFERSFTERWVTGFVSRAEELSAFRDEETRQSVIDNAYTLIETLSLPVKVDGEDDDDEEGEGFRRDFLFQTAENGNVEVFLHDKLAGTNSADPDDVGLQSWGASILFSRLVCRSPENFGLGCSSGCSPLRVIELGAGTGLVSLVLGALLPKLGQRDATVIATDYHDAVLENLAENVRANLADHDSVPILTCALDWSAPVLDSPLHKPADILVATDVIYSPLHAAWVKQCASQVLAADGVFWLMTAVRQNGRFEGVSETVKAAFATEDGGSGGGRQLLILETERLEKPAGVGRGDESWYELFKIGWK